MTNKRTFSRQKRRLLVEFTFDGVVRTGFSRDVSQTGLFVQSRFVPSIGQPLTVTIKLPGGPHVALQGKVVRGYHTAGALASFDPGGFSFELGEYVEAYANYVTSLG